MKHVEAVIRIFDPANHVRRITVRRRNRKNKWVPARDYGRRRVGRA